MEATYNKDSHSFSVQLAKEIGLEKALILKHLYYWCYANSDNQDMIKNGYIWVYITRKKIEETYPYLTNGRIRGAIKKLEKENYIIIDCFNKLAIDKTNWYALTDKGYKQFGTSIAKLTNDDQKLPSNCEKSQAIQSIKKEYNTKEDTNVSKKEKSIFVDLWKNDYSTYKQMVLDASTELKSDKEFRLKQETYFPNINYEMSIDKGCDYWLSDIGYKKCKQSKTTINILSRLKNNFDKNKIYYGYNQPKPSVSVPDDNKDMLIINGIKYQ